MTVESPRTVQIVMRDGAVLHADVYGVDGSARRPAILMRTPYDRTSSVSMDMIDLDQAIGRGYCVVIQDTRGRFASDGVFEPFRPDIDDGYDTVEWVASSDFCSGEVVMTGFSAVGATQWLAAIAQPPALRAISPGITASDYYEGWVYQGGAFQLMFNVFWAGFALAGEERRRRGLDPTALAPRFDAVPLDDVADIADLDPFYYRQWLVHDEPGPYWTSMSPEQNAHRIRCPVLLISGWFHAMVRGSYRGFQAVRDGGGSAIARSDSQLIIGPWASGDTRFFDKTTAGDIDFGPAAAIDAHSIILDFFDRVLGRTTVERGPRIRYFTMGANEWRSAEAWPPPRTQAHLLYLRPGGVLGVECPEDAGTDETLYDPSDPMPTEAGNCFQPDLAGPRALKPVSDRRDVLVYRSEPLDRELEITGEVSVVLYASSTAASIDYTAALGCEINGQTVHVCDGIRRVTAASAESPIHIDMLATSIVIKRGAVLVLRISHSNFPRFNANLGRGEPLVSAQRGIASRQTIFFDARRPSRVVLPVAPEGLTT